MEIIYCEKSGDVIPDRKVEKSCVKEQFGHICENYLVLLITKINKKLWVQTPKEVPVALRNGSNYVCHFIFHHKRIGKRTSRTVWENIEK